MMNFKEYIPLALRTKSDQFHDDLVHPQYAIGLLGSFEQLTVMLDAVKKTLFYGRPLATQAQIVEKQHDVALSVGLTPPPVPSHDTLHAMLGLVTELAELNAALRTKNPVKIADELGDLFWYIALLCRANAIDPEVVMAANIAKLKARFPDKFTSEAANLRDEGFEKTILQTALAAG